MGSEAIVAPSGARVKCREVPLRPLPYSLSPSPGVPTPAGIPLWVRRYGATHEPGIRPARPFRRRRSASRRRRCARPLQPFPHFVPLLLGVTAPAAFSHADGRDRANGAARARPAAGSVYLSLPGVVERYAGTWSKWQLYEWTRTGRIPHRKLPGRRELIFPLDELEAFEDGAPLETLPDGGRVCRPARP